MVQVTYLSIRQAADRLGVSTREVQQMIDRNEVEARILVLASSVEARR